MHRLRAVAGRVTTAPFVQRRRSAPSSTYHIRPTTSVSRGVRPRNPGPSSESRSLYAATPASLTVARKCTLSQVGNFDIATTDTTNVEITSVMRAPAMSSACGG